MSSIAYNIPSYIDESRIIETVNKLLCPIVSVKSITYEIECIGGNEWGLISGAFNENEHFGFPVSFSKRQNTDAVIDAIKWAADVIKRHVESLNKNKLCA